MYMPVPRIPMPVISGVETDYIAESQLDDTFDCSRPLVHDALNPGEVFLTGATGRLGAFLFAELMKRTRASVCCLVRAADDAAAGRRLVDHLKRYGVWREEYASRLRAVAGDVSLPRMGLTGERFDELARETGAIYHSAGRLNMASSYAQLKPANVNGTREVLRLACAEYTKPVHFVSSIGIFYSDLNAGGALLKESDPRCFIRLSRVVTARPSGLPTAWWHARGRAVCRLPSFVRSGSWVTARRASITIRGTCCRFFCAAALCWESIPRLTSR